MSEVEGNCESEMHWVKYEKARKLVRIKEKNGELICNISSFIWQWMRDNRLRYEKETWGNRNMIICHCVSNTIDSTRE